MGITLETSVSLRQINTVQTHPSYFLEKFSENNDMIKC